MTRKITWHEPTNTNITKVEVNVASTLYGTYSVSTTANATSDGNVKSSSNTWVTTYTDDTGVRTDWYKIRFFDSVSSTYSDFSDPVTSEELLKLCTVSEIKNVLDTVGRWTDDEIFDTITAVEDLIYIDMGTPIKSVWSYTGKINDTLQDTYYVGEENIYRVDRVFYGTTTKTEYFLDDGYKTNLKYGMIRFLPVASTGPTLSTNNDVEIHYVPKIYNELAVYRTAKRLLERSDFTSGDRTSKELQVIENRLKIIEDILSAKLFNISSAYEYYSDSYGVNRKKIVQDHDRNKYIGQYGW